MTTYTVTWRDHADHTTRETDRMAAASDAYALQDRLRARGLTDAVVLTYY